VNYTSQADPNLERRVDRAALWENPAKTPWGWRPDHLLIGMSTLPTATGQKGAFADKTYKSGDRGRGG